MIMTGREEGSPCFVFGESWGVGCLQRGKDPERRPPIAVGNVPDEIIDAIRLGRTTALSKPDGGVRGIRGRRHNEEPNRSRRRLRLQHHLSSTLSLPKQGASVLHTCCRGHHHLQ